MRQQYQISKMNTKTYDLISGKNQDKKTSFGFKDDLEEEMFSVAGVENNFSVVRFLCIPLIATKF
jgi:hypothetical protein